MINLRRNIYRSLLSALSMIIVFFSLVILKYLLMRLGGWISGFEGYFEFNNLTISINLENWTKSDVLWIYLLPYAGYLIVYIVLSHKRKFPVQLSLIIQLLQSWAYVLLLIFIFFMPLIEIIGNTGIYYPLSWLRTDYTVQMIIGIISILFFLYRSVNISQLFSTTLFKENPPKITPAIIFKQLLWIWYLPVIVLITILFFLLDYQFTCDIIQIIGAIVLLLVINTLVSIKYNYIVS